MKSGVVFPLLTAGWLAFGFTPPAWGGADVIRNPSPEAQAAVADTVRPVFRAAEERDIDRLEALHLYGPKFSKFDEFGLGRETADEARSAERAGLSQVKSLKVTVEGLKVDVFGVAAVATFFVHYRAETSQGDAAATLRSTVVLVKDAATWRIAHEHFSPLVTTR